MEQFKSSLKKQFYITTIGIVVFIIFSSFSYNMFVAYQYNKNLFIDQSSLQTEFIADNIVEPLLYLDKKAIQEKLLLLGKYKDIFQVSVYDKHNKLIILYSPTDTDINSTQISKDKEYIFLKDSNVVNSINSNLFIIRHNISLNSINYGYLYLIKSTATLNNFFKQAIYDTILFLSILLIIAILFTIKVSNIFINPIVRLSETIIGLAKTNNYSTKLTYAQTNEIGKLYHSFNSLFESIDTQQKNLQNLNNELEDRVHSRTKELQESLSQLKKAQSQLIESEKMAALGSLVSGVAHEINTPLGNALTGSSMVHSDSKKLINSMNNATLKKSTLENILKNIEYTSSLVLSSIQKASSLVRSFKQISVDQNFEDIRIFNVYEYTQELILTFKNQLRKVPIKVNIHAPKDLEIESFPGIFAQILSNLIQNSLLHGFETKKENAIIDIKMYIQDNKLHLTYMDNGSGIDPLILNKVFEPFVTTKRNSGGTGLGLNILYNLVTQKLQGKITLESKVNDGVTFSIIIPTKVKDSNHKSSL